LTLLFFRRSQTVI